MICEKLDYQHLGLFVICGQINDVTFCLDLHSHMHIRPMFYVLLLELRTIFFKIQSQSGCLATASSSTC